MASCVWRGWKGGEARKTLVKPLFGDDGTKCGGMVVVEILLVTVGWSVFAEMRRTVGAVYGQSDRWN